MLCRETLGSNTYLDVTLTYSTHMNIAAEQTQPSGNLFPEYSRSRHPSTLQKLLMDDSTQEEPEALTWPPNLADLQLSISRMQSTVAPPHNPQSPKCYTILGKWF